MCIRDSESVSNDTIDRKCKLCETGQLSLKNSFRGGAFIGCSNYPECKFTRPLSKSKASQQINLAEPKLIGKNDLGKDIFLKNGRFGPYLQFEIEPTELDQGNRFYRFNYRRCRFLRRVVEEEERESNE